MAVTNFTSNTQTLSNAGTEHVLATITTAGVYQLWWDLNTLAAGDVVTIRVKTNILTGGTSRSIGEPIQIQGPVSSESAIDHTIPYPVDAMVSGSLVFTAQLSKGLTSRAMPWKVLSL